MTREGIRTGKEIKMRLCHKGCQSTGLYYEEQNDTRTALLCRHCSVSRMWGQGKDYGDTHMS